MREIRNECEVKIEKISEEWSVKVEKERTEKEKMRIEKDPIIRQLEEEKEDQRD